MARFIVAWMVFAIPIIGYETLSISTSSTEVQSFEGDGVPLGTESIDASGLGGNSQYGQLTGLSVEDSMETQSVGMPNKPLNYPNPFQLKNGTTIGYNLTKDTDIKIEIYNAFGHKILTKNVKAGANGGSATEYNRVRISYSDFNYDLPAGPYFYTILSAGELLGKGRMAIIP